MNQIPSSPSSDLSPVIQAQIDELLGNVNACINQISREAAAVALAKTPGVIAKHRADFARAIGAVGEWIAGYLAQNPAADEVERIRAYIAAPIRTWSRTSLILFHVLNTPRDRFDGFEIAELLLERRTSGADIISEIFDDYYQHMTTVEAYRHRFNKMVSTIADETTRRTLPGEPVRILSLHTGSAPELALLTRTTTFTRSVALTCVDADALALRRVRQKLEAQFPRRVHVVRADPRSFVAAGPGSDPGYDIIYTVTMLDQLSDRQTTRLIAGCYHWLKPGGVFIFGNFSTDMPVGERMLIAWAMNWDIRCRSEAGLRQIFARTSFGADNPMIVRDPSKSSLLAIAERT